MPETHPDYLPFLRNHLEEVSDFRARYQRLLRTRHVSWNRLAKWEERHRLHLSALRLSREGSLELARSLLRSEWVEEAFGGAATLLVCDEAEPVLTVLAELDPSPRREALLDALFWHAEGGLAPRIWGLVESRAEPELRAELLLLLGRRREFAPAILQRALRDEHPEVRAASLITGASFDPSLVEPFLQDALSRPALEHAGILALLDIDPRRGIGPARNCVIRGQHVEALLPTIAALGEPEDFELLLGLLGGPHEALALLALGFHGSPRALPVLVAALEKEGSRRSHSAALEGYALLSGWPLALSLLPEPEEDLTDDRQVLSEEEQSDRMARDAQREALRAQAREHWQGLRHCGFADKRLRHGAPWSLSQSLRDAEFLGGALRAWTFRELGLHTRQPALADAGSFHDHQAKALRHWAQSIRGN